MAVVDDPAMRNPLQQAARRLLLTTIFFGMCLMHFSKRQLACRSTGAPTSSKACTAATSDTWRFMRGSKWGYKQGNYKHNPYYLVAEFISPKKFKLSSLRGFYYPQKLKVYKFSY